MSEKRDETDHRTESASSTRRNFLKFAGLGAAAGAVAVTAGGKQAEADEADKPHKDRALYRETDHVKRYYELAKF